jgi:hypothetical protein
MTVPDRPGRRRGFGLVVVIVLLWNAPLLVLSVAALVWLFNLGGGGGEEGAMAASLVAVALIVAVVSLVSGLVTAAVLTAAGLRQRILAGNLAGAAGWLVAASVTLAPVFFVT